MQAGVQGRAAVAGVKRFSRKYMALAANPPGEDGSNPSSLVDGKLNFRVRKRRQAVVIKTSKSSQAVSQDGSETTPDLQQTNGEEPSAAISSAKTVVRQSARQIARLKRAAEERSSLGAAAHLAQSQSKAPRRTSKKNGGPAVMHKPAVENGLPTTAIPNVLQDPPVDFWHSSLSENSEAPIVKDLVEDALVSIRPGTTLSTPEVIATALEHLKSVDPLLKVVIEAHEGPKFEKCTSAFSSLGRSIVFQQLATKAASAIFGRLVTLCEGLDNFTPMTISQLSAEQLRTVGLSGRKAEYLHDLAANFLSGALADSSINVMDDVALMKALTAVKGIGVWSVHMFMLFSLHRPDVLPVGDLGVRKGFQNLYKLKGLPSPAQVEQLASRWQPYRSLGSWYMWRVVNNIPPLKQTD